MKIYFQIFFLLASVCCMNVIPSSKKNVIVPLLIQTDGTTQILVYLGPKNKSQQHPLQKE